MVHLWGQYFPPYNDISFSDLRLFLRKIGIGTPPSVFCLTSPLDCLRICLNLHFSQVSSYHYNNIHNIGRYWLLYRRKYSLVWLVGEIYHYP